MVDGSVKTLNVEEKIHHHQEKKKKLEIKINSMPRGGEEKKKGMRSCKSEVWGESGMVKMEKTKGKKEEQLFEGEKIKMGMRSSKSAVWSESEMAKMEKGKGKKEEQGVKASCMMNNGEEKKMGMRSSKSAVWSERVKMERGKGKKEEQYSSKNINSITHHHHHHHQEEKKVGMRSSRSAVWGGESEIVEREKGKEEPMQMGMRSCRSEIWSESEIVRLGKTHVAKEEEEQQLNVLNKRVEDFIARVNNQRLLEAKIVDHSRG